MYILAIVVSIALIATFYLVTRQTKQGNVPVPNTVSDTPTTPTTTQTPISAPVNTPEDHSGLDKAKNFYTSSNGSADTKGVVWAKFNNSQVKGSPTLNQVFDTGTASGPTRDHLFSFVSQNEYDLFRCGQEKNSARGIYFSVVHQPLYGGDYYADAKNALDAWQPYIFRDTAFLLFPHESLSEKTLSQPLMFDASYSSTPGYEAQYKGATVMIGQEQRQLYYGVVMNNFIVATSKVCLLSAASGLFDLVP